MPVFHDHVGIDAPADIKPGAQAHESWLADGHQIIKDAVADGFVKRTFIAK